jgi:hypothetical protein
MMSGAVYPDLLGNLFEKSGAGPGLNAGMIGEIRFWSFPAWELPDFWYFCNGDRYSLSSPQGQALARLSAAFKAGWIIEIDQDDTINVPNFFNEEGDGYFIRPADGVSRLPGSVQGDAMRNFPGQVGGYAMVVRSLDNTKPSGPFEKTLMTANAALLGTNANDQDQYTIRFDPSLVVPTAEENRPINVAMTPAIFLAV